MNLLTFPALAADVHERLGITILRDITFDPSSGILSATVLQIDAPRSPVQFEIHRDDHAKLVEAAGAASAKLDLRVTSGGHGNICLVLLGSDGGAAWLQGAVLDLPTPAFALEKLATRSRLLELGKQCAAVAHEIRQPLFTIAMASENLRFALDADPGLSHRAAGALDHIEEEVERARAIVDQTLNYAAGRGAKGASVAERRQGDVTRAVAHARRLLGFDLEKAEIAFSDGTFANLPHVALPQVELEQVLLNILRNAIESIQARKRTGWSGDGAIRVAIQIGETALRCTVSDNGAGLDNTASESGFQPFVTTKGEDGNGLGLYVCEQLLGNAGGSLKLLPGDREGARVEIEIPLAESAP